MRRHGIDTVFRAMVDQRRNPLFGSIEPLHSFLIARLSPWEMS